MLTTNAQGLRVHRALGIPHALYFLGRKLPARLGRVAPRDCEVVSRAVSGKDIKSSNQVPLSEYVGRCADIMAMAAALTIHGDQAGRTLRNNQADLTAGRREILNNPNGSTDAALKPRMGRGSEEIVIVRGGFGLDPTKKPLCVWRCRARLPIHLNRG